jgi:hypothetical protein
MPDPMVEIINSDKENIWLFTRDRDSRMSRAETNTKEK